MVAIGRGNVQQAMERWAAQNNTSLESLDGAQKQQAIQDVAKELNVKPLALLGQLESLFPDVFSSAPKGLEQLGAQAQYNASAGQMSQTGRVAGTQIQAMMSQGVVGNKQQVLDFFNVGTPADIRDKTAKYPEMAKAYAQVTADQLMQSQAALGIPPRAQTVARKALEEVAAKTTSHFGPDGFGNVDDPRMNALALGQHAGYVAGEFSRKFGVGEPEARKAIIEYFEGGGDINQLIGALKPDGPGADFFKDNGWMVGGSFGDDGKWGFWGFGGADKALNRPGLYAGEATLKFAEALDKGNGEQLLASVLSKPQDELASLLANPEKANPKEAAVAQFAARAAQLGWLSSKLGQGIVEAHNPKKEANSLKRWAPGNDLITDFNSLEAKKGWGEVAKDLDQIKAFAIGTGVLTPNGNPANSSYYVMKDGKKLDRELLHAFEKSQAGPRDGRVSAGDVKKNVAPELLDGKGPATDVEMDTLAYAKENFNFTGAGAREVNALELQAKLGRAEPLEFGSQVNLQQGAAAPDQANLYLSMTDGKPEVLLRDSELTYGRGGGSDAQFALSVNGQPVGSKHSVSGPIPYGEYEGDYQSTHASRAELQPGPNLIEITDKATGKTRSFNVDAPPGVAMNNDAFAGVFSGGLSKPVMLNGQAVSKEPGKDLLALTHFLVDGAHQALASKSFNTRNDMMARVVGDEAGLLAARAAGLGADQAGAIQDIFRDAANQAGNRFRLAFDSQGNKLADQEAHYKTAMSAAGEYAFDAMDDLAKELGVKMSSKGVIDGARIEDIAGIVARDLGLDAGVTNLSGGDLKALIDKAVPADDYFRGDIAGIPLRDKGERGLSEQSQDFLGMGIRLANATWKAGQVHRAAWEGNDGRINPEKREAFNTFDALKITMFDSTVRAGMSAGKDLKTSQQEGFARVVFEVYKDLIQLQKAAEE